MPVEFRLAKCGAPIAAGDLEAPTAALVSFVERHAANIARFIEARREENRELVVLEFRTGKPQDSVIPQLERALP